MSYKDVAMLTRVRIELPQMTKKDDKATEAAERANKAHGAGVYRKDLYPKHLIEPITAIATAVRTYLYSQARPYGWSGSYLIPNTRLVAYLEQMGKYELQFRQAVTAFLNNWANVLFQAQQTQGDLFDATVYPDVATLAGQFVFEYPLTPLPAAGDVVLNELDETVVERIKSKVQDAEREATAAVFRGAFVELREQVLRIIKQTTVTETKDKDGNVVQRSGKIYDTLTTDIANLTAMLTELGMTQADPELGDLVEQIDMHLTLPADALRGRPDVCKITSDKAKDILAQMEAFL